ncbi:MAG: DUF456 domain-containing protein [Pseudomonadales bacterium]|jgi:uncharacterized protein YqgC (DUF456 family)|nr:DUF456 domain-containing protein [Pseudomonadales bacterium]
MEIVLIISAFLLLVVGLVGSIIPAVPGPTMSYVGLILLQISGHGEFGTFFLIAWALITLTVTIMDSFLPTLMTKYFGGSRWAMVGSVLGLIIGLFLAPIGIIVGPFLGALIGELINELIQIKRAKKHMERAKSKKNQNIRKINFAKALKVATGAFLAFIVGTGAKLTIAALMLFFAIVAMFT